MNRHFVPFLLFSLIIAVCLHGCNVGRDKDQTSGDVVVRVNGSPITSDEVAFTLRGAHGSGISLGMKEKTIENLIDQELIYQKGLKLGLDKDPKYREMVKQMELRLLESKKSEMLRRVYNTQIASRVDITDQDAREYFDKNSNMIGTELRLAVLRFSNKDQASQALKRLKDGTPFEKVASEMVSPHAEGKKKPWDIGFVEWNQVPSGFREMVFSLKPGEVSDIIEDKRTGIQIIKVVDIRQKQDLRYESMRGSIMEFLRDRKIKDAYEQYIEQLRREARIVKFNERRDSHEER